MISRGRRNNFGKVVAAFAVLLTIWLIYLEVANLWAWHVAHRAVSTAQYAKDLNLLPQRLPDVSQTLLAGSKIERFGFSLQTPWKFIDKERNAEAISAVSFRGGGTVIVWNPSNGFDRAKFLREVPPDLSKRVTALFGTKALGSNYDLMAAELEATPAHIRWWATRASNAHNMALLINKSMDIETSTTAIYPLHAGALRGFQFGDPAVRPYQVKLDLFDRNDRHYQILISSDDRLQQVISQSQINALVNSIRPLP